MSLDQKLVNELKEKLLQEKIRLEKELGVLGTPAEGDHFETKFPEIGDDAEDNASEVEQYADNLSIENNLESQLKDINDALDKMEKGIYGVCEKTGEEIPVERLKAYPAARTIVDA